MPDQKTCTIPIEISGRIESRGLRIRCSSMMAFYISSENPDAAKYWCRIAAAQTAVQRGMIIPSPGDGIEIVEQPPLDWDAMLMEGKGALTIRVMPKSEARAVMSKGQQILSHEFDLVTQTWQGPKGPFLIVFDPGGLIDSWIVDSATGDLAKH